MARPRDFARPAKLIVDIATGQAPPDPPLQPDSPRAISGAKGAEGEVSDTSFWIHDPKKRLIRAAPFRDRVEHHALNDVLAPVIERGYVADTYACIVGRGSLAAVRRYEEYLCRQGGRGYVLKADVRHYFPSVDHAVLRGLLRRKIGDDRLLRLLDGLVGSGDDGGGKGVRPFAAAGGQGRQRANGAHVRKGPGSRRAPAVLAAVRASGAGSAAFGPALPEVLEADATTRRPAHHFRDVRPPTLRH